MFFILVLFFVFAGHTDFFAQDYDWHKHHAIFYDLKQYSWPVVYSDGTMLTYYIGQYLVPSLVGKIFNSDFLMSVAIALWNAWGITIVYFFLIYKLGVKKGWKKTIVMVVMLTWGGVPLLGALLYNTFHYHELMSFPMAFKWIDGGMKVKIHFASNFDALRGAFQHVIPVWISTCLFIEFKENKQYFGLIALPLFLSGMMGFIYLVLLMALYALCDLPNEKPAKWVRSVFSLINCFCIPAFMVLLIYYMGAVGYKPKELRFYLYDIWNHLDLYFIFIFVEFLAYVLLLRKFFKKDRLFVLMAIELIIIPFFGMGLYNDLCSRGSIPARFILMVYVLRYCFVHLKKGLRALLLIYLHVLAVSLTVLEIYACVLTTKDGWNDRSFIRNDFKTLNGMFRNPEYRIDEQYNYFTVDFENCLFRVLARQ